MALPLLAAGARLATGKGAKSMAARTGGRMLGQKALGTLGNIAVKVKGTAVSLRIGVIVMSWYFFGQLPLYLTALFFLVLAILNPFTYIGEILSTVTGSESVPGIGIFGGLAGGFSLLVTGMSWVFLVVAVFMYKTSGINCLSGKKSDKKLMLFLLAFVGYGMTFFQFFPWAIPWLYYVGRNPE